MARRSKLKDSRGVMMRERPTSSGWTTTSLALTVLVLLLGGLLLYHHASGQRQDGNGAAPSRTQNPSGSVPSLTEEELTWLREHPVIRVAQDPGWPPVEFDNEKGEPSGISNDYLNLIEQRLGIKFERIRGLTWQESYARLERWEVDMTTCVVVTQDRLKFWAFTKPYLTIPIVILTRTDVTYVGNLRELNGNRVAVVDGYAAEEWLRRDYPEIELVKVKSVKEGMELLQRRDVFAFVDNMLVIGYYLAKLKMGDLKIAGPTRYINAQSMAVRKDWAILAHILDKALDSITDEQREQIYQKWVPIRYEHGVDYKRLWQVLALVSLIVGGLLLWNRKLSREIRYRRQAEAALTESERRYRDLWEKTPVMMISLDSHARVNFASDQFCEELGYDRKELLERKPSAFQTAESAHYAESVVFPHFLKTGAVKEAPLQLVRKNGEVINVLLNVTAERDAEGKVVRSRSVFIDVTDRMKAEEALREQEQKYRLLAENTLDVIWQTDLDLRFTYANPAVTPMTGHTVDEWIGSKLSEHCDKENFARMTKIVIEEIAKGPSGSGTIFEARMIRKTGEPFDVEIHGKVLFDDDGLPIALQGVTRDISDRKRAEEALCTSESQLANAVEMARLAHWELDVLKNEFTFNDQFYKLFRTTAEQVGGYKMAPEEYVRRFVHPDEISVVRDETRKAIETADPHFSRQLEHRIVYADGDIGHISVRFFVVKDEQGRTVRTYGVNQDITERKRAEEHLREKEAQYREIFESSMDTLLVFDLDGSIREVNPAACQMYGYSHDEMIGLTGKDIVHPDCHHQFKEFVEKARAGERFAAESVDVRKDGSPFHIEVRGNGFEYMGRPHLLAIVRDVTERKETVKALKEAYDIVNKSSSVAFTWKNMEGWPVEFVSENVQRLLGYAAEEFIRGEVDYVACIHPQDMARVAEEVAKHSSQEETSQFIHEPYRVITKDGTEKIIRDRTSIVRGNDGRITHYKGIVEDITEQRAMEAQLRQAQKMEAIGTLAGGVSHDFNNILQVALGYSELLLGDEELPLRYRADLQKINDSAKRGADLVQRLLTFSRKTEINPQPLDLNLRITELRKMLERTLPKMVEIKIFQDAKLAYVNADKTQMDQVLMNLAVNARDAMPDGGKLLFETANVTLDEEYVRTNLEAKPGLHVLLTVTDTGSGMDKDTLQHIFEPFYTTKGVGEGTGLGLAMVHGIVKQHGGHIMCYSELGKGTTFKIYLPALISEEKEAQTLERPMPQGGSETILLVDDEEFIRDLGSRILEKAGYTVITAANGKEALDLYERRSGEIALVLLDLIMPEMGGKQCLEGLLSLNPSVKVIIASGFTSNGPTKDALEAGAKGFANKPYDMRQVREVVRQVLDAE